MYGITETTVHASFRPITAVDLAHPSVSPIGRPLPDLDFTLIDEAGRPVPPGAPGELCIAGPGLARGYLNRDDLTAERFVAQPDAAGGRSYRSGDRAVRLEDGQYAYLGRTDDQIKVRGYRIEPREIEMHLAGSPQVSAIVVVPRDYGDGDVRLVAYVVPAPAVGSGEAWFDQVRADLAERAALGLPAHMRPSTYVPLDRLPLTANGKVDRSALPEPRRGDAAEGSADGFTPAQAVIADLWCSVLDLPTIGLDDDFFDLGGTSLALVRMFSRVNDMFATDMELDVLVDGATVGSLARHVSEALGARSAGGPSPVESRA
jgi:acyl-coenzyme A synthetase/AMP-(fatty) acid ligase